MTDRPAPDRAVRGKELWWFILLACGISWVFWTPIMLATLGLTTAFEPLSVQWFRKLSHFQALSFSEWLAVLGGAGPIGAAILVTWRSRGSAAVKDLWARVVQLEVAPQWYLAALLVPMVYIGVGMWLGAALSGSSLRLGGESAGAALGSFAYSVLSMTIFIVCEELGWRGFMLPRLQADRGALRSSVIVGVAWAYWHLPYFISMGAGPRGSMTAGVMFALFSPLMTIPVAILMAWVFNGAHGSIFIAMLFHAANNSSARLFTVEGGSGAAQFASLLAMWVAAIAVILIFGARNLSRRERFVIE